jgi:hypothetical protein
MSGISTATVETLTAEVRVLMVGSRQVTQSVAKQLDRVPLSRLRPFGRVKLSPEEYYTLVIGADPDGVLAVASAVPEVNRQAYIELDSKPGALSPLRCAQHQPTDGIANTGSEVSLSFDDWPIALRVDDMETKHTGLKCYISDCDGTTPSGYPCDLVHCDKSCQTWQPRDYHDEITAAVTAHRALYAEDQQRVADARALPLIVLAGLR